MPSESSYWILTVPVQAESSTEQMYIDIEKRLAQDSAATSDDIAPLPLPALKTGTLESLITLSEDFARTDALFTSITTRISDTVSMLVDGDEAALAENLQVNGEPVDKYLFNWRWNSGKYRQDRSLPDLIQLLTREMQTIDHAIKQRLNSYNSAKSTLQQLERRHTGNLSVRAISDVVKRDDVVPSSDFLETLLVAVPRNNVSDWNASYERLASMVVPRSAHEIARDDEFALFSVVVFKKVHDEFVQKAREHKYVIRDFTWDEGIQEREQGELQDARSLEKELWHELLQFSSTNFDEAYEALQHFKVIRAFVESVLRFGLPAEYFGLIIRPNARRLKALVGSLAGHYSGLSEYMSRRDKNGESATHQDTPGEYANLLEQEVFPFVLTEQLRL
ncbi:Vacuolar ATP synthase subunit C [Malassezia cuniculi]|uniref:V-type proton ATPase subunit C n=1 Tax=Malassezia cuniculi TaxID=948313 RepID=A0AAF0J696_9BASI|nr:Vacuolar ATP synthase subunit C [Malassezia cuniculi]